MQTRSFNLEQTAKVVMAVRLMNMIEHEFWGYEGLSIHRIYEPIHSLISALLRSVLVYKLSSPGAYP